jgi:hypothetical protein
MASLPRRHGTTVGGERVSPEKDHTLTDRVCTFKTVAAECQESIGTEPAGEDFSLDIHSYRTIRICMPQRRFERAGPKLLHASHYEHG